MAESKNIAQWDQQIDGVWYHVGDELPDEKPLSGAVEVSKKSDSVSSEKKTTRRKKV